MMRALHVSPSSAMSNSGSLGDKLRLEIGEGEGLLHREAVGAPGGEADQPAVQHDRLVAAAVAVAGVDLHVGELDARALLARGQRRGAADELLVEAHEALHVGLDHGDLVGELAAPGAVGLLHPQAVHRIGAEEPQAVCLAGLHQGIEHGGHVGHRAVQLPAEFAHVVDPERAHPADAGNGDLLRRQPGKRGIGQIGVRHRAEHVARQGPGQHQAAEVFGDVADRDVFARRHGIGEHVDGRAAGRWRPTAHRNDRAPAG
jgi:hypothetical protein